jgi:hypothetical protein
VPLDRSEVPTLIEPVRLRLKFCFHVEIFQLFLQQKLLRTLGCRSPELGQFLSFFSAKVNLLRQDAKIEKFDTKPKFKKQTNMFNMV